MSVVQMKIIISSLVSLFLNKAYYKQHFYQTCKISDDLNYTHSGQSTNITTHFQLAKCYQSILLHLQRLNCNIPDISEILSPHFIKENEKIPAIRVCYYKVFRSHRKYYGIVKPIILHVYLEQAPGSLAWIKSVMIINQ